MISSIINSLKHCRNLESKLYSSLIAKNCEFTSFRLHSDLNAHFHSLNTKENFRNLNVNKNQRTFANAPERNNLFRVNKYDFNFKNNVKLSENSDDRSKQIFQLFYFSELKEFFYIEFIQFRKQKG